MKTITAAISLLLISFVYAQEKSIDIDSGYISSFTEVMRSSAVDKGCISFEKKGIYYEFLYNDSFTQLRILSFPAEKKELVYLDTKSRDFTFLGIRVGMTEDEIQEILGEPVSIKRTSTGKDFEYFGRQYMLVIEIANKVATGMYYNPFE